MPSEKTMKNIVFWLIIIIFISFLMAVVLFVLSGDNWFTASVPPELGCGIVGIRCL